MLRTLKEKLFENFEVYQEQVRVWWTKLAPREKIILISASSLLVLVLTLALGQQVVRIVSEGFSRKDMAQQLSQVESQLQRVKQLQRQANRYDSLMGAIDEGFQFEDEAQKRARRSGLELDSVKPSASKSLLASPEDKLFELKVSKGTSLDQSLRFLDSLESVLGVRMISLNMKPSFKNQSNFEIAAVFAVAPELQ